MHAGEKKIEEEEEEKECLPEELARYVSTLSLVYFSVDSEVIRYKKSKQNTSRIRIPAARSLHLEVVGYTNQDLLKV